MTSHTDNSAAVDEFLQRHPSIQALPEHTSKIMRMTSDINCNAAQLVRLIERDGALAGAIMKAVNSAYYSLPAKMTRLDRAVAHLGMKTVKEIVSSICLSKMCRPTNLGTYNATDLWEHGVCVAITARELAVRSMKFDYEEAFLTGILQDIGLMLAAQSEAANGRQLLAQAELTNSPFDELEQQFYGFTHSELGAALAKKWSFLDSHMAVIQYHHHPSDAPAEYQTLCNHFYIADTLACRSNVGCPLSGRGQAVEDHHLEAAGLTTAMVEEVFKKLPLLLRLHLT